MQNKRDTLIFYFLPFCPTHITTSHQSSCQKDALSLQFRILIYRRVQAGFSARQIFDLVIERRNIQCNDFDGLRFLDRVAHIDVADLIFGDEMSSDPKSFQKKLLLAENAEGTKLI